MAAVRGESRTAIHRAATELFATRGYANTPVRDIAALAGVDAALVIRHFGSKEQLVLDTMRLDADSVLRLDVPIERLGERIAGRIVDADAALRTTFIALVRASDSPAVAALLRALHDDAFVAAVSERLDGADREVRARLVASLVGGLMYALWIVRDPVLAAEPAQALIERYAPLLQALITPPEHVARA